jgi:hypothetical protein
MSLSAARSTSSPTCASELLAQVGHADVMRGRQHGEHVAAVAAQHHALGETIAGDVADLGGVHRRQGRLMRHHVVGGVPIEVFL